MSKFRKWQDSRKEISFEEFREKYPNSGSILKSKGLPVKSIFVYLDGTWIVEQDRGFISLFFTYIRDNYYYNEDMEMVEIRQYLYQYERDE